MRAQDPRPSSSASSTSGARRSSTAKGPLPDPALLDGSAQPAEKRPEYGMLGQFEIPGDDNSKSGKVGGQQQPPGGQQSAGGGQQGQQGAQGGMSGMPPAGMPQGAAGGAAGGPPPPQGNQGGGGAGGPPPPGGQSGAGGIPGGQPVDPSQANGQGGGIQVAEMKNDGSNPGGGGAPGEPTAKKPQQVALGDPTMQIKGAAATPGVVGGVTAGNTQQMEKPIGAGGRGGGGDNGTTRSEKGRVVPTGL